jgi:hypothetical protein
VRAFAFVRVYRSRIHHPDGLKEQKVAQFYSSGWLTIPGSPHGMRNELTRKKGLAEKEKKGL